MSHESEHMSHESGRMTLNVLNVGRMSHESGRMTHDA